MSQVQSRFMFLLAALAMASAPALAQGTEKAPAKSSIAGMAATAKQAPAKVSTERKKYEFVAQPAAADSATQQSNKPVAERSAPAYLKDKSTCHSQGSDA